MTWEKEQSMSAVIDFIFAYTLHVPSEKFDVEGRKVGDFLTVGCS